MTEDNYIGFEVRLRQTIEDLLETLEDQFPDERG